MRETTLIMSALTALKTTFAREYLPAEVQCLAFINADLIADGLSPFRPEQAALRAGRLMLELIEQYVARGESFGFETTLATKSFARSIPQWQGLGYVVSLYFLTLPSAEQAIQRVARRVRQGGHAVAKDVVRRRFVSGWENFEEIYRGIVDEWVMLDNSGPEPIILKSGGRP